MNYTVIYIMIFLTFHEGVSKSPRTMLITPKSLVVHEFPARVCCGGLVSECAEWRGWMWKRLIVARVFMCVLHQPSAIF